MTPITWTPVSVALELDSSLRQVMFRLFLIALVAQDSAAICNFFTLHFQIRKDSINIFLHLDGIASLVWSRFLSRWRLTIWSVADPSLVRRRPWFCRQLVSPHDFRRFTRVKMLRLHDRKKWCFHTTWNTATTRNNSRRCLLHHQTRWIPQRLGINIVDITSKQIRRKYMVVARINYCGSIISTLLRNKWRTCDPNLNSRLPVSSIDLT